MISKFEKGVVLIQHISLEPLFEGSVENVLLVKEYLRRAARFLVEQNIEYKKPLFDAASMLTTIDSETLHKIKVILEPLAVSENAYVRRVCECYLSWCFLLDNGNKVVAKYENLYDSLIKFFERGGVIAIHKGELIVDNSALPLLGWIEKSLHYEPYNIGGSGHPLEWPR